MCKKLYVSQKCHIRQSVVWPDDFKSVCKYAYYNIIISGFKLLCIIQSMKFGIP